jgi:hypothetical protein
VNCLLAIRLSLRFRYLQIMRKEHSNSPSLSIVLVRFRRVKISFIFSDNIRIWYWSCNVEKSKTNATFYLKAVTDVVLICSKVSSITSCSCIYILLSFLIIRSTWIRYQKKFRYLLRQRAHLVRFTTPDVKKITFDQKL